MAVHEIKFGLQVVVCSGRSAHPYYYGLINRKDVTHTFMPRWDDPELLSGMLMSAYRHIPEVYIREITQQVVYQH